MSTSVLPKACRNCRVRKIRCDKKYPCSACQTSGIECHQISNGALPQRASYLAPPSRLNQSIDVRDLSRSIDQINVALQQLLTLSAKPTNYALDTSEPFIKSDAEVHEGVSSFTSQALVAGEASQALAGGQAQLAAAQEGLRSLRELVADNSPSTDSASPKPSLGGQSSAQKQIQLLPIEAVLQLIKAFKTRTSAITISYGLPGLEYVEETCRHAYFPIDPPSHGQLAVMHGLMYYLLWEWKTTEDMPPFPTMIDFDSASRLCEANFDVSLHTYEVMANASYDNILALYLAATKAKEDSSVKRAWSYTTCAARHVLNLGWHRRATFTGLTPVEAQDKLRLFWNIYALEKSLALTLGHTATMRDDDIDIGPVPPNPDERFRAWDEAINCNARIARIEGHIFDRLYTASALTKTAEERVNIVQELAASLEDCIYNGRPRRTDDCIFPDVFDFAYGESSDVSYYSLLTTLHRGTFATSESPGNITQPCYDAARKSLQAHLAIIEKVRAYRDGSLTQAYLTWALQYGAFTPLIVVFLHAISTLNEDDLSLLQQFQGSLSHVTDSDGIGRLQSTCAIFISVAKAYVDSRPAVTATDAEFVRRENVHQAFGRSHNIGNFGSTQQDFGWDGFEDAQIDEMSTFMNNWMDGSQQAADLFSIDFEAPNV